jgi:hypothetical protein
MPIKCRVQNRCKSAGGRRLGWGGEEQVHQLRVVDLYEKENRTLAFFYTFQ